MRVGGHHLSPRFFLNAFGLRLAPRPGEEEITQSSEPETTLLILFWVLGLDAPVPTLQHLSQALSQEFEIQGLLGLRVRKYCWEELSKRVSQSSSFHTLNMGIPPRLKTPECFSVPRVAVGSRPGATKPRCTSQIRMCDNVRATAPTVLAWELH